MIQQNIDMEKKSNDIAEDLYDVYNKMGKYELWLNDHNCELSRKRLIEDRKIIGKLMKQFEVIGL